MSDETGTSLKPFMRMRENIAIARSNSDTEFFHELMYYGEFAYKLAIAAMVAAIAREKNRLGYKAHFDLVRADGLGDWAEVLDEVLTGPSAQYLAEEARIERKELTQKCGVDTWQFRSVRLLHECVQVFDPEVENLTTKLDGRRWFRLFVRLRNKTRGHGAPKAERISQMCEKLESSINLFVDNFHLFRREWVYLHRNLSGKYNVGKISKNTTRFDYLRSTAKEHHDFGVYVFFDNITKLDLVSSDASLSDFYIANGNYTDKKFEMLSYITNDKKFAPSDKYRTPVSELPSSETEGIGSLDIQGSCFGNLPGTLAAYVERHELEKELMDALKRHNHPIVTLHGSGGIGKTSLALHTLHEITEEDRFSLILWFSARDIDLLPSGPKPVKPKVLDTRDVANEFVDLVYQGTPTNDKGERIPAVDLLARNMSKSEFGPTLFVFDNFETLINPPDFYKWIDTYVREPNKILITSRYREFKADYPIEVRGMTEEECGKLIETTAKKLKVEDLLSRYHDEIFRQSDGHPYVIKILVGEVANSRKQPKVDRIIATSDEMLRALFERTYDKLSPAAQRCFLMMASWRVTVPLLAVSAVLVSSAEEPIDVAEAINELENFSFAETARSEADDELFISIPLVTARFGQQKLAVSPLKSRIEEDTKLLHQFGGGQKTGVRHGVEPRLRRLFKHIGTELTDNPNKLSQFEPMMSFIGRKYPRSWLNIADVYEETNVENNLELAKTALRNGLQTNPDDRQVFWKRLASLSHLTGDLVGVIQALVEMCEDPRLDFFEISNSANRMNGIFHDQSILIETEEKRILVGRLANIMNARIAEGNSDDRSRLAWLYLHLKDDEQAEFHAREGLQLDPSNHHCINLADRLGIFIPADTKST